MASLTHPVSSPASCSTALVSAWNVLGGFRRSALQQHQPSALPPAAPTCPREASTTSLKTRNASGGATYNHGAKDDVLSDANQLAAALVLHNSPTEAHPNVKQSSADTPLLEIRDLHACMGDQQILKGVTLQVNQGEVHVLMGPNGAGKSTLTKVLMGHPAYTVTAGSVKFLGRDLLELAVEDRARLGLFVGFQHPIEIAGLPTFDFLHSSYNAVQKARGNATVSAADFTHILERKRRKVGLDQALVKRNLNENLSGGERKYHEVLQMCVLEPKLSILDEADSGLDVDAVRRVSDGIRNLLCSDNALLLVTHYQHLMAGLKPTHVHVMVDGRVVESGNYTLALKVGAQGFAKWMATANQRLRQPPTPATEGTG